MMRKKYSKEKKHRNGEIPTGSFSDIAFLLIIYFLVATTMVKLKSINADMPSGQKSPQTQTDKTPTVKLNGPQILFNDKPVDLPELETRLAVLELDKAEGSKKVILLESTKNTPYENYFHALAAISANGGVVALVEEEE